MSGPSNKGYKRSWKNLLLNKRYQLRFTLFMVGLSALLMAGLGFWVMREANVATAVGRSRVVGEPCVKIPDLDATVEEALPEHPNPAPPPPAPPVEKPLDVPPPDSDAKEPKADKAAGKHDVTGPHHVTVQIDDETMTLVPPAPVVQTVPKGWGDAVVAHWSCEMRQAGALDDLERGHTRILLVLVVTSIGLLLGLAVYGINSTHKVAGPLFKVTLYLGKMREGRFDKVYNLRKGDQLVDFYNHFKTAHAGVVKLEREDLEQLRAVIAAAEAAGVEHDVVGELRALVARKEKSLE